MMVVEFTEYIHYSLKSRIMMVDQFIEPGPAVNTLTTH